MGSRDRGANAGEGKKREVAGGGVQLQEQGEQAAESANSAQQGTQKLNSSLLQSLSSVLAALETKRQPGAGQTVSIPAVGQV